VAYRLASELAPEAGDLWAKWKRKRLLAKPKRDLFAPASEIGEWLVSRGIEDESVRVAVYLHFWRLKNRHLLDWESNQRQRALAHRKDLYNRWAKWLVSTYDTIVLEEFDLRSVAKRANPEDEDDLFQAVRHNRTIAAISELRLAIKERAAPDAIILRPASRTTITCNACRHVEDFDRTAELAHTCSNCKRTWDQDWNAGANLLLDVLTNDPNAPPSRERSGPREISGASRKGRNPTNQPKKTKGLSTGSTRG
jgi:transposase